MVTSREGPVFPVFPPGSEQQVSPLPTVCLYYAWERVWSSLRQSMQYFQGQGERECDQRPPAVEQIPNGTEAILQLVTPPDCPNIYSKIQIEFCVVMNIETKVMC